MTGISNQWKDILIELRQAYRPLYERFNSCPAYYTKGDYNALLNYIGSLTNVLTLINNPYIQAVEGNVAIFNSDGLVTDTGVKPGSNAISDNPDQNTLATELAVYNLLQQMKEVKWVTYNTDTYSDVQQFLNEGYVICCYYNNEVFYLTQSKNDVITFSNSPKISLSQDGSLEIISDTIVLNSNNTWSFNRVTGNTSSNSKTITFKYQNGNIITKQEVNKDGFIAELPEVRDDHTRNSWMGYDIVNLVNIQEDDEVIRYQFPDTTKYVFGYDDGTMVYSNTEKMEDKEILTTLSISDQTNKISEKAFYYCTALGIVTIPDSIEVIEDGAFYNCVSLKEVNLPDSLIEIGEDAFYYTALIGDLIIPDNVEKIGDNAFVGVKVTNIYLPDSIELGNSIFARCKRLKHVELPQDLETIPDYTFQSCPILHNIELPDSLIEIGAGAFDSSGISTLDLNNVQKIGEESFANCLELNELVIPDNVIEIGNYAFGGSGIGTIDIGSGVSSLPNIFEGCKNITSISIPGNITELYGTFSQCENLSEVTFEPSFKQVIIQDEVYLNGSYLLSPSYDEQFDDFKLSYNEYSYTIPLGEVMTINDNIVSFQQLEVSINLENESASLITNSPVNIGDHQFNPGGYYSINYQGRLIIGDKAFRQCSSLETLTLPESVTDIGEEAFSECSNLTTITLPTQLKMLKKSTFAGCYNLSNINLKYTNVYIINENAFDHCGTNTGLILELPTSLYTLSKGCFIDSGITQLIFNSNPSILYRSCFAGLQDLEVLDVRYGIPSLCQRLFKMEWEENKTKSITQIILPNNWVPSAPNQGQDSFDYNDVFLAFPQFSEADIYNLVSQFGYAPDEDWIMYLHYDLQDLSQTTRDLIEGKGYNIQFTN